MARYLRQLAEQALKPANALRSAAAVAFSPEPAVAGDEADTMLPSGLAMDVPLTAAAGVATPRPAQTIATSPDSGPLSSDAAPARAPMAGAPASGHRPSSADVPAPASTTAPVALPAARRNTPPLAGRRAASDEALERPAHDDPAATPSPHRLMPAAAPTLTPVARPAGEPQALSASPRGRVEPAAERAPDIHIHIGRIELSAATPAAAPKRKAATAAGPMTLDAYLRQRGRKAP